MSKRMLVLLFVSLLVLVGCQEETGDTDRDTAAAQSFFPAPSGYTVHETESVQQAISAALGATALASNPPLAALVERTDTLLSCYREVGAVDAQIYVENISTANITESRLPLVGALVVINQDRVIRNFASCVTSNPLEGVFAQAQTVEPCTGNGSFEFEGETITYAYAASDGQLCNIFSNHFAQY